MREKKEKEKEEEKFSPFDWKKKRGGASSLEEVADLRPYATCEWLSSDE